MNQLEELREIDVTEIVVNPFQPRKIFIQEDLNELAASIRSVGLIHPPTVRPAESGHGYEIISGERRFRAAQLAGMTKIPVLIRHAGNALSAEAALVENIQRVDLNPIEIAKALQSLSEQLKLNQEELALRVGKKRSTVANYLRLLSLPLKIQESVEHGRISMGHAKAILSVPGAEKQNSLHEQVIKDEWNVRQTEEAAHLLSAAMKSPPKMENPANSSADVHLVKLAELLQTKFGTKVSMNGGGKQGKISIDYYSLDDLDRLLEIFGVDVN